MKESIAKRISCLYSLFKINIISFLLLNKRNSDNIIIIDNFLKNIYYGDVAILHDLSYIYSFIKLKKEFTICNSEKALNLKNKKIYLNLNKNYLKGLQHKNYSTRQIEYIVQLERKKNIVFPSSYEASFWENKINMYSEFKRHKINHPQTSVINNVSELESCLINHCFPVISKIDNGSGSAGIIEIKNKKDKNLLSGLSFPFLLQDRLTITKDCRIVILNFKYHNHYFRNNTSSDWHPTSTSLGSYLSYEKLPEEIIGKVIGVTKKLNLRVAAFDICWENDDLTSPVIFLEVSTSYLPNPKYYGNKKYKEWKTILVGKNPYWKSNVQNFFSQKFDLFKGLKF